jgi:hypothetical protein
VRGLDGPQLPEEPAGQVQARDEEATLGRSTHLLLLLLAGAALIAAS